MRSRTLERWQRIEIGRKSEEEEGFLVLGRGVIWESFQGDGKVEEFMELKRSGMTGKVTGGAVHDQAAINIIRSRRVGGAV